MAGYIPDNSHGNMSKQEMNHYHEMQQNEVQSAVDLSMQRPNSLMFHDCLNDEEDEDDETFGDRKHTLALRLQQRRPRKVLADQGIIPPLKSPATYFEQVQKLERARKGDFLNKKMLDRPERDFLVQKHILEDTQAYDSIVAHQKELKKAKLVDDLNEKIFFRPGVFELVEKNILPADDNVTEAIKGGHVQYKKTDDFNEEDSSDGFSPGQPFGDQSTSPLFGSPPPSVSPNFTSGGPTSSQNNQLARVPSAGDMVSVALTTWGAPTSSISSVAMSKQDLQGQMTISSSKMPRSMSSTHSTAGHPYLIRQTSGTKNSKVTQSTMSQRNMRKKKEKPKFKKFKYHQYVPPDQTTTSQYLTSILPFQQGKASEQLQQLDSDTPYSRLLEQQQLYLQLQIMEQHYPTLLPPPKSNSDKPMLDLNKNFHPVPPPVPPMSGPQQKGEKTKRTFSIAQLEEMKVAELKEELKARNQKVTGTKEVLVERLKRFAMQPSKTMPNNIINQPISQSITGLINATIQSTIRANTEQALAAAVGSNGPANSLLLRTRTLSPPIQQNQDGRKILQAQLSPPPRFANKIVGIQVVTSGAQTQQTQGNTFTMQQVKPSDTMPMDTQSQDQNSMDISNSGKQSKFHFTTTSNGVQIFTTTPAMNTGMGQSSTANNNQFFGNANTPANSHVNSSQMGGAVPGQRVIATPNVQFKVEGAGSSFPSDKFKDRLLHKQQQEIEDLRRMVELHRTQLHQIQEKERQAKQDAANSNNNTSNSNQVMQDQQDQNLLSTERLMQRQHISEVLQKHLQNRINNKDQTLALNGLNTQMQLIKQEIPPNQVQDNIFFSNSSVPPNVSLVPLNTSPGENSGSVHAQQEPDAPVILSIKPPLERCLSENKDPPKYDQAIQMLHQGKRRQNPFENQDSMVASPGGGQGAMTNADMDDLLELLADKGEIPITPDTHKNFPQQATIDQRQVQQATMHYHIYNPADQALERDQAAMHRRPMDQIHRTISANELDNIQHRRSLELPALIPISDVQCGYQRKDPNLQRRHSGDLLSYSERHTGLTPLLAEQTDFTSLLVSSAGDILMDATRLPPSDIQGRMNYPNCISPESVALQHQEASMHNSVGHHDDASKNQGNAYLNLNDPYATQPFSPMDTTSSDGPRGMMEERVRDPHLSSSSIHDSEPSLDKCVDLPSSTGSYLRHYGQPLAAASPHRHSHLTKSSSQELLAGHSPSIDQSMQVDLGWLDLPSNSPFHCAPSPLHQRLSMHSSVGSILEHDDTSLTLSSHEPPNSYHLGGDGLMPGSSDFAIDYIDSLDLNSIGSPTMDDWDGTL